MTSSGVEPANLTLANILLKLECKKKVTSDTKLIHVKVGVEALNSSDNLDMRWLKAHQLGSPAIDATSGISLASILLLVYHWP